MTGFTLKNFSGDLATDPEFVNWAMAKADESVKAGADAVVNAHLKILAGWERKPAFAQEPFSDFGKLEAMREIGVIGPNAWKWIMVNYGHSTTGGNPVLPRRKKFMSFKYSGVGKSYLAATDTQLPKSPVGNLTLFSEVSASRSIKARDMIGKAYRALDNGKIVYQVMKDAWNG